ncbi:MAG: hypothetical protein GY714_13795 [Desulfobacterales bacterium]|nr:hypothetical protein [Desulfobacterales bacterium]
MFFRFYNRTIIIICSLFLISSCNTTLDTQTINKYRDQSKKSSFKWSNRAVIGLNNLTEISFYNKETGNQAVVKETKWFYINKKNPGLLEEYSIHENNFYVKIEKLDVDVYYPDKSEHHFSSDVQNNSQRKIKKRKIIDGNYKYTVKIPDYRKGVLLKIVSIKRYSRPEFLSRLFIRSRYPQMNKIIRFRYPVDNQLNFGFENKENIDVERNFETVKDLATFEIEVKGLNSTHINAKVDLPENWYASLNFSLPPKGKKSYSWKELGDHYLKLVKDAMDESTEIKNLASSLLRVSKGKRQLIENSFDGITNRVRYNLDTHGKYAFIPRNTSNVLKNGYGDCKEINSLIKVLLEQNSIKCNLALVKTRGNAQLLNNYPNLGSFNHMISFSEVDNLKKFLDGTNTHSNSNNSYYHLIGRKAFILSPGKSRIQVIERDDDYKNEIETETKIDFNKTKKIWMSNGKVSLYGKAALNLYNKLKRYPTTQKKTLAAKYLQQSFGIKPFDIKLIIYYCENIEINYKSSFQESFLQVDSGGFKLSTPSVYNYNNTNRDKIIYGKTYFEQFNQKDVWIFPKNIEEVNSNSQNLPYSQCFIGFKKNKVYRQYSQISKKHTVSNSVFESIKKNQTKIMKAVAWN